MKNIIGLDIIRGFAIFLVLIWHWIPENHVINFMHNGKFGVNLFFVLSGYLISKSLYETQEKSAFLELKTFYIKRFFRIFPIIYILLIILYVIDYENFRQVQGWYWLYLVNVFLELGNNAVPYTIHFWSLAVEEQFYIFWPIIFLLCIKIKKFNYSFFITVFLSSIIFHFIYSYYFKLPYLSFYIYFYTFSIGAFIYKNKISLQKSTNILLIIFLFSVCLITSYAIRNNFIDQRLTHFYLDLVFTLLSASILIFCILNESFFTKNKRFYSPIIYLGKISYGVYLFHYFMYPLNHYLHITALKYNLKIPFTEIILFPEFNNIYIRFIYFFVQTVLISTISYYLFEKRFIRLSKKLIFNTNNITSLNVKKS